MVRELPHLHPLPKVTILNGRLLRPVPPGSGKDKDSRWVNVHEDALDEDRIAGWMRPAAALPGWRGFSTL